jgi:PUA domain protein
MAAKNTSKLQKKRALSRKNAKQFREKVAPIFGNLHAKTIGVGEVGGTKVYVIDGVPSYAQTLDILFPTLNNSKIDQLPHAFVDMGAVPYVCKGADVMSPGVVNIEGIFSIGDLVVIRDINHGKALAITLALLNSIDFIETKKGKAFKNLHYVGDKIWGSL